jgi:hypothetical protein
MENTVSNPALELLSQAVKALAPGLQASGELNDPVFSEPAQYGTAYYAYCNAVLAKQSEGPARAAYAEAAGRGLAAALTHLFGSNETNPAAADYTPAIASPSYRNLRDFMWPPVMRTFSILRELDGVEIDIAALTQLIRQVDSPAIFSERPPVNWAAVWILGEWHRIRDGLSPYTIADVDGWLEPFFSENPDVDHGFYKELREATGKEPPRGSAVDLERGFYREPGVPNSYDLFSRVHLLELLVDGYDGTYAPIMRALLVSGMRRSLGVQLSSGSLASAYRSSGHLWNIAVQAWYFFHGGMLLEQSEPELSRKARIAALRAFRACQACLRPTGDISPVENVLPANWRVGYEVYTMEAHYVSLAISYIALAIEDGFVGIGNIDETDEPRVHVEEDPVNRSLVHRSGWSVHVNLAPFAGYDSLGIADITLGVGRRLRFGGQTHYGRADTHPNAHRLTTQMLLTLGLAAHDPDHSIHPVSMMEPTGGRGATPTENGFTAFAELERGRYEIAVGIEGDVASFVERLGDGPRSLVIPYLRDRGDGHETKVTISGSTVRLNSGDEIVEVVTEEPVRRAVHLPFGYESRNGLVGMVRLDLEGVGPVRYRVIRVA